MRTINTIKILAILLISLNTLTALAGYVREDCVVCDYLKDVIQVEKAIVAKDIDALNRILKAEKCFILDKKHEAEFYEAPNLKYYPSKIILYDKYVQNMPFPSINPPKRGECSKVFYLSRYGVVGIDKSKFKNKYYFNKGKRRNCGFDDAIPTVTSFQDILRSYFREDN